MLKRIDEGALLPRGYGLAYFDMVTCRAVLAPLGLNLLIRWVRHAYIAIRVRYSPTWWERKLREAWHEGRTHGMDIVEERGRQNYNLGFSDGMQAAYRRLQDDLDRDIMARRAERERKEDEEDAQRPTRD